jgi:hypothetical protein
VGVKPQVYVPTYKGYVPLDGLEDGQSRDRLSLLTLKTKEIVPIGPASLHEHLARTWYLNSVPCAYFRVSLRHSLAIRLRHSTAPFTPPDGYISPILVWCGFVFLFNG